MAGGLFADASGQEQPSPLSLVPQNVTKLDAHRPARSKKLDAQAPRIGKTGRPVDGNQDPLGVQNESHMPSRLRDTRPNLRTDRRLTQLVKDECNTERPAIDISRATEDGWRLWLAARGLVKLDAQAPNGSSSGIDLSFLEELIKTTTTKTLGAQKLKSPPLPGFAAKILELVPEVRADRPPKSDRPYVSRHVYGLNWAYALDENRNERGIKNPVQWVEGRNGNIYTGKFDGMIDLWLGRMQRDEDAAARRRVEVEARVNEATEREAEIRGRKSDGKKGRRWEQ